MSVLGEAGITLTAVSDACSTVLSPSSCVIHADFDGSNPVLTQAYTDINLVRGNVKLAITTSNVTVTAKSNNDITYSLTAIDQYTVRLKITGLPTTILSGSISFKVALGAFEILTSFPFSITRESSMLDWIQDWNTRRTSIDGNSIITPKLFAGAKDDTTGELTGIYLGPDTLGAGIYGYKDGDEVFHINSNGASIGGWNIETGGIASVDATTGYSLQLLSSGSIIAKNDQDETIYALYRNGEATFANGNVLFHANGNAEFTGKITAKDGRIGNWIIAENAIHQSHIVIDSLASAILVLASDNYESAANSYESALSLRGGVKMHYTSAGNYGLEGWLPALVDTQEVDGGATISVATYRKTFSLGSTNQIGSWFFDHERLYSNHVALVGREGSAGLYMAAHDISEVAVSGLISSLTGASTTGIYLVASQDSIEFAGYKTGNLVFRLGTQTNQIAGWNFDNVRLWTGDGLTNADGFTTASNSIIMGQGVMVGPKWRFSQDGSGKLAGGALYWDVDGNLTIAGGTLKSGASTSPAWILNPDGTGKLAGGAISWTSSTLSLTGTLNVSGGCVQLANAGICSEGSDDSSIRIWAGTSHAQRGSAPFRVQQDGTLYSVGGTLDAVKVNGVLKSTFQWYNVNTIYVGWDDEEEDEYDRLNRPYLYYDNISVTGSGDFTMASDPSQSGRQLTFTHYMTSGGSVASGNYTLKFPSGSTCKFFENGLAVDTISFSREIIVLKGYGTATKFFGWIVISRANIATTGTYGRDLRCIAQGVLRGASSSSSTVLKYRTFDNSALTVKRESKGLYTITIPSSWGLTVDHYIVMATGLNTANNDTVKPTLTNVTATSFQLSIADDSSRNDGGCYFQIFNMDEWFDVTYRTTYGTD